MYDIYRLLPICSSVFICFACTQEEQATVDEIADLRYHELAEAAKSGSVDASFELFALVYADQRHLGEHIAEARAALERAAQSGHLLAQYNLGALKYTGEFFDLDKQGGIDWLTEAASRGQANAQLWLGRAYLDDAFFEADTDIARLSALDKAEQYILESMSGDRLAPIDRQDGEHQLAQIYLSRDFHDREGWILLRTLADRGYEPAAMDLRVHIEFIKKEIQLGSDEYGDLLTWLEPSEQ